MPILTDLGSVLDCWIALASLPPFGRGSKSRGRRLRTADPSPKRRVGGMGNPARTLPGLPASGTVLRSRMPESAARGIPRPRHPILHADDREMVQAPRQPRRPGDYRLALAVLASQVTDVSGVVGRNRGAARGAGGRGRPPAAEKCQRRRSKLVRVFRPAEVTARPSLAAGSSPRAQEALPRALPRLRRRRPPPPCRRLAGRRTAAPG